MRKDVAVGVTSEAPLARKVDTGENERHARYERVCIDTDPDP